MIIHWSLFAPGLLLLLFPADRLLSARIELHSFEWFRNLENSPRHRPWWWVPALWLDPVRGLAGTWLVRRALGIDVRGEMLLHSPAYWWLIGILTAAMLSQVFTRRGEDALLAPMGFAVGVVGALVPWPVTVIGFTAATVGLFAFRHFLAFFGVGLAAVALLGAVLRAEALWLVPAVGVLVLPLLAGLLSGCSLELPTRRNDGPPPRPKPAG